MGLSAPQKLANSVLSFPQSLFDSWLLKRELQVVPILKRGDFMSTKLVVGLDGSGSGERAVEHARKLSALIGECEVVLVYVIEWSPYTFQTAQENEERHKRREEEIATATSRIIDPALKSLVDAGFSASGVVRHGDVAQLLNSTAKEVGAEQIIVARSSESGFAKRIFGTATANLVMSADVPVTVVG